MKLIISHTHATYVMEDIVVLRGNCLSVTFLEKKKKKVSASAPGSHCYATQQLDIQVNRSSTSVGGRKNAKPWCLSSGDTFTTSEKQTRGLWEVNIVERVQCIKLGGGDRGSRQREIRVVCRRGSPVRRPRSRRERHIWFCGSAEATTAVRRCEALWSLLVLRVSSLQMSYRCI